MLLPLMAQDQLPGVPPVPPAAPGPPATTPAGPPAPATVPGQTPGTPIPPPPETSPDYPPKTTPGTIPLDVTALRASFSPVSGLFFFYGEVVLVTQRITINADELTYNERTRTAIARGNVAIHTEDKNTYWGNILEYSVDTRKWRFLDYAVEYPSTFLGAPFIAPVFVNGQDLTGIEHGVRAENSNVTTCNLADPHYIIHSRRVDIYPGDKLIARDNDFYVLGHRIVHIPYLVISLRQRQSPIIPQFGQNPEEGYYARFLYQYVFNPNELGGVRLDLTQKLGPGLGVDHFYSILTGSGTGEAFAYARQGLSEYVLRLDHQQKLPNNFNWNVRTDVRENSRFTVQPTTLTMITSDLSRTVGNENMRLLYTRNLNQSQFRSDNSTANFIFNRTGMNREAFTTNLRFSSFHNTGGATSTPPDSELWSSLNWVHPLGFADFNLQVDHHADIEGVSTAGGRFFGVQRLPEASLVASRDGKNLGLLTPFTQTLTVGWGIFNENGAAQKLNRYRVEWASPQPRWTLNKLTTLTANTNIKQTVYGDKDMTAQYVLNGSLAATTKLGAWQNVLNYNRTDAHGFPALNFDAAFPAERAYDSLQYVTPKLSTFLTAGRDLKLHTWDNLTFSSLSQLSPSLSMSQAASYDLNASRWNDLISRFSLGTNPLIFNTGTQYSITEGRLQRVTTEMRWQIDPKWSVEWLGGYDGLARQFLYNEFLVKRDLHCWDIALYYSQEQKTGYLYLRLKALNMPLPELGIGRGGQVLNTSQGSPF